VASRDTRANLALLVLSALLSVLAFEGVARLFVRPSARSWGTLLGRDLPPLRVIPPRLPEAPAPATAAAARWSLLQLAAAATTTSTADRATTRSPVETGPTPCSIQPHPAE